MLTPVFIAILASVAAFIGGTIALRFKDKLHIILGFSAGTVIGVALFDLIPEAIELGGEFLHVEEVTALVGLGFLIYLVLDRVFSFHIHGHNHIHIQDGIDTREEILLAQEKTRGSIGAASFSLHSLIDGIVIGLAFQASSVIGTVVAIAVIAHRFSDGINTVGVILKHYGEDRRALVWLCVVAIAPVLGTLLTYTFSVSDTVLAIILSVFSGFFLYIGASDLIPEGHHSHSKILTTVMTLAGAIVVYIIVYIAHQ
jgi:zinc transporter ZupT